MISNVELLDPRGRPNWEGLGIVPRKGDELRGLLGRASRGSDHALDAAITSRPRRGEVAPAARDG